MLAVDASEGGLKNFPTKRTPNPLARDQNPQAPNRDGRAESLNSDQFRLSDLRAIETPSIEQRCPHRGRPFQIQAQNSHLSDSDRCEFCA